MTFNTALCAFSAVLFTISALLFVSQAIYALDFRKKIALSHGFSEAIMTGPYYPLLIIFFSLIFIQFISFIALGVSDEFNAVYRIFAYTLSFILFLYFRYKTPPLLTYWLGKTCLWRKAGATGKIPYSKITGIRLSSSVKLPITDTQRLCKVTFFIDPEFSSCKKISCLITAYDLEALSQQIDVFPPEYKPKGTSARKRISGFMLPLLMLTVYVLTFLTVASTGIFNSCRYFGNGEISQEEIKTVTAVTSVGEYGDSVCVYYGKVGVINVYGKSGEFRYAINCPFAALKPSDFSVTSDGYINYRSADTIYRYSVYDGSPVSESVFDQSSSELLRTRSESVSFDYFSVYFTDSDGTVSTVVTRSRAVPLFNIEVIWVALAALIAVSFTVRSLGIRKENDLRASDTESAQAAR